MEFSDVKVIVFDLDGTLYEDTHHFDYYAELIKKRLPEKIRPLFEKDYTSVQNGKHSLKIGRVYDVKNDLILVQLDGKVREAYDWHGKALSTEKIQSLYPEPIVFDFTSMINVGDPWWTPVSVASHYGLDGRESYEAFLETREYMMSPKFEMETIHGFRDALVKIRKNIQLVVLTNSPEPDSEAILKKIGIHDVFDMKIFNGMKPSKTIEHFETIKNHFNVSFGQILSVGDNWINEIRPARNLGCSTIFLDRYGLGNQDSADLVVKSIKEVLPILEELAFR